MISIIICSRTQKIPLSLQDNIHKTIGCAYELVTINNSENKYSIFEAYNIGIEKSIGKYVCFIHDDIHIHTNDWGIIIKKHFKNNARIGLIGVAGSKVKTKMPSAWWDCDKDKKVVNIIQHFPDKKKEHWNMGFKGNSLEEVVVIDGVFMAWLKDERIKFNEKLKGFHNYDLSMSLECKSFNYQIGVTNKILIEHFSLGTLNKSWFESAIKFHDIYKSKLPLFVDDFHKSSLSLNAEFNNGVRFIGQLMNLGLKKKAIKIWLNLVFMKPLAKYHFNFIKSLYKM